MGTNEQQHDDHCWLTAGGEAWAIFSIRDGDTFFLWRGYVPNIESRILHWPKERWARYAEKAAALLEGNAYRCPFCGFTSMNPNDIEQRYCGHCHAFEEARDPEAAYQDDSFPERACDHCGLPYRGPAVYCSLSCALADA